MSNKSTENESTRPISSAEISPNITPDVQKTAQLKIINRFGATRLLPLNKPVFTIGRKPENDLQLLTDMVSRLHAEIRYEDDTYYLVDVGSKRGTYVNDQRVERCALLHQDRLRIGGDNEQQLIFLDNAVENTSATFNSNSDLTSSQPLKDGSPTVSANEELQKLARFVEVNQAFKFSMTPDDVLCLIVDAAIEITQSERGFLMLLNSEGNLEFKVARDRNRNWIQGNEFEMSRSVVEESFKQNRSVIISDSRVTRTGLPRESDDNLSLRSIACIPLRRFQMTESMDPTVILKRDVIGVLYVDSSVSIVTSQTSLKLLESLAFEATKSLENVRLMHEEAEKKKLEIETKEQKRLIQELREMMAVPSIRRLRIFLCHASGDKPFVRKLYNRLLVDGMDPWLDEESLLPGQHWKEDIPKAVRSSDVVIVCLSHSAITKEGYVQKEIKIALDVADEKPEGTIYIIPFKLEECPIPSRLSHLHWVNFFEERGYERLMKSLQARAAEIEARQVG